ncbi:heavy metal transport/detoxification protein [Longimycelium tulufanense]|uniref:Heavy metal transport/detoxification protein n=1 Tax=Longimycelium tulufanense TaxID=907463 RepID=A0A8J3CGC2_9PSEU|nr:heavy-metal-associated domain-containing protein [Longimycelium tulufanense]GGM56841.1 heavy metal transport/detoxification protein [Longimycelium tulufanense]
MSQSTYTVTGMSCGHCANAVTEELGKIAGVSEVAVDVPAGLVTVTSAEPLREEDVRVAVEEAGYELTGVN